MLTYDLVNWSHWTCLNLAVAASLKDFLSHTSCQMLFSDLWMGGMKIRKYVTYKVIAALLFPPALFLMQFKTAKELQYMPQTQEEHFHANDVSISDSTSSSDDDSINIVENLPEVDYQKKYFEFISLIAIFFFISRKLELLILINRQI